jgi:hypothetical protein
MDCMGFASEGILSCFNRRVVAGEVSGEFSASGTSSQGWWKVKKLYFEVFWKLEGQWSCLYFPDLRLHDSGLHSIVIVIFFRFLFVCVSLWVTARMYISIG